MVEANPQSVGMRHWNFGQIWVAFLAAIVLQSLLLPCLCFEGAVKGWIALGFDILVLFRVAIAWGRNETGRGWLFYVILLYTSPFWIEGLVRVVMGG